MGLQLEFWANSTNPIYFISITHCRGQARAGSPTHLSCRGWIVSIGYNEGEESEETQKALVEVTMEYYRKLFRVGRTSRNILRPSPG